MKRIVLVANTSWYFYNFRLDLFGRLRAEGHSLVLLAPEDEFSAKIREAGFTLLTLPMHRRSMNPFGELVTVLRLWRWYVRLRPDLVHHFTVKCVLYGTIAAYFARVPAVLNSITGLGHLFLSDSTKVRAIRYLLLRVYRVFSWRKNVEFLFQNADDRDLFLRLKVIRGNGQHLVKGSGVDTTRFSPKVEGAGSVPVILFASRLLREKGIFELMEGLRQIRANGVSFQFRCAGAADDGNPSAVRRDQLEAWRIEGLADFLGHVDPIDAELNRADIVVLPSWREGMPKILLEAASCGKAILTTDVPGCREVVEHEVSGWMVPAKSPQALEKGLSALLTDKSLRQRLGAAARERALRDFDQERILEKTLSVYRGLLNQA